MRLLAQRSKIIARLLPQAMDAHRPLMGASFRGILGTHAENLRPRPEDRYVGMLQRLGGLDLGEEPPRPQHRRELGVANLDGDFPLVWVSLSQKVIAQLTTEAPPPRRRPLSDP